MNDRERAKALVASVSREWREDKHPDYCRDFEIDAIVKLIAEIRSEAPRKLPESVREALVKADAALFNAYQNGCTCCCEKMQKASGRTHGWCDVCEETSSVGVLTSAAIKDLDAFEAGKGEL